ncbi:unnamed protein product [Phaedon cochleariae]|uniref:C2H2-type domain-containing protein n=1 Tax=Phaedon cochleariae TaxID=80249 RepID=A0A9N9SCR7_PHACE|nr:unnamed protein product [Phaedon cochleariae]
MSTLSLKCPLCCDEQFSSYDSLKYHILAVVENVLCPACNMRFENVLELAEHVGRECKEKDDVSTPVDVALVKQEIPKIDDPSQCGTETEAPIAAGEIELQGNEVQSIGENNPENMLDVDKNADCRYMCEMCNNMEFTSVQEHLDKYHEGEDVVLDTGENGTEDTQQEETEDNTFEIEDSVESPNDLDMEMPDAESDDGGNKKEEFIRGGRKINEFWLNEHSNEIPITEYYVMTDGRIIKIGEEEASRIDDRNSVIEIHQCPRCFLQFPKMDHYMKHICNPDKSNDNFKCAHCRAVFHNYQSLNAHMRIHIPKDADAKEKRIVTLGPHPCDECGTTFPSYKSMKLHQRMHDPKAAAAKCRGAIAKGGANDKTPMGVLRQMFVCNICTMTYDKQYEEIHMRSHKIEESFNCMTCNRKFDTKENLEMHSRVHSNVKKYVCSYCKKPFATEEALKEHVTEECRDRNYECQYCGRRFSRPHEKVKHERIHTGEKPHVCQICGKSFRVSYCLTLHLRTHSGDRPYECKLCDKRFKSYSVYNHHLLTHSEVRAYRCPYCPKAFKTAVQWAGHRNSHTKPFNCKECNRPFASLYAVKAHMETHKRENNLRFDCFVCGATYARDYALRDHVKSQHPEAALEETAEQGVDVDRAETLDSTELIEHEMVQEDEQKTAS